MLLRTFRNCNPFVLLNFFRLTNTSLTELNIQIDFHKQDEVGLENLFKVSPNRTYMNLDFYDKHGISFDKGPVDVFITMKKTDKYNFTLDFMETKNNSPFFLEEEFKNSINNIRLKTCGRTKAIVKELNITPLSKSDEHGHFQLKFNISQDRSKKPNEANNIIYNILKNKKGSFSIQVQTPSEILIEYKVNLRPEFMCVLSSNRLMKHIKTKVKDSISQSRPTKIERFLGKIQRFMKFKRQ